MIRTLTSLLVASSYVASIHWGKPNELRNRDRNDGSVIKFRLTRVVVLCCLLALITPFVTWLAGWTANYSDGVRRLGVVVGHTPNYSWTSDVIGVCQALSLMVVLYVGPIMAYVTQNPIRYWMLDFRESFCTLQGIRDYIMAPVTEEFIYRSVILSLMEQQGSSRRGLAYTPLFFGVAHLHHAYELYHRKALPVSMIAFNGLVQILYTTIFGVFANYVFFRFRTVWACAMVHSVCNLLSFPEPVVEGSRAYQCTYYGLLVAGVYGFYRLL